VESNLGAEEEVLSSGMEDGFLLVAVLLRREARGCESWSFGYAWMPWICFFRQRWMVEDYCELDVNIS
jgi:hypothetical protein